MPEFTTKYIISQILIFIVYFLMSLTFFAKSRKKILWLNTIANCFFAVGLYLLGGISGMYAVMMANVRNAYSLTQIYRGEEKETERQNSIVLILIIIVLIISAFLTYSGNIFSLFLTFATILFTYAIYQKNVFRYKVFGIVVSTLRLIYNVFVFSIVGIVFEIGLLIATVVGVIRDWEEIKNSD